MNQAHSFVGASMSLTHNFWKRHWLKYEKFYSILYVGAPENPRCTNEEPKIGESLSYHNFGKVYIKQIELVR